MSCPNLFIFAWPLMLHLLQTGGIMSQTKNCTLLILLGILLLGKSPVAGKDLPLDFFKIDKVQETRWNALRNNTRVRVLEYNRDSYQQLKAGAYASLKLHLPTPDGDLNLSLTPTHLFSEGFILSTDKEKSIPFSPGLHYNGHIEGQPGSMVAISFFEDEVVAVVNSNNGNQYTVGKSNAFRRGSFVIYDANKITAPSMTCHSEALPNYQAKLSELHRPGLEQRSAAGCVNIYLEAGKSVFDSNGGIQGATNFLTGLFNVVSTLYTRENLSVVLSQILIWTTNEPFSTTSSLSALNSFGSYRRDNFNGDVAQFVRIKPSGGLAGIAWLDVLCDSYSPIGQSGRFSYAELESTYNNFPTYSWTSLVVTHEIGHNLGSPHTHSCSWPGGALDNCNTPEGTCAPGPAPVNGGTIMSYCHLTNNGTNLNNGFGTQPGNLIRTRVNAATCLSQCNPVVVCANPQNLSTSNLSHTGVTLNWTGSESANSYTIQYRPASSNTWITATSAISSLTYNLTGLQNGTSYAWQVRANCSNGNSDFIAGNFNTPVLTCNDIAPSNLTSSNNTSTSTTVRWLAVSGAASYEVQYKRSSATTWTTAISATSSLFRTLINLTSGVGYDWRVRANCSSGQSPYSQASFMPEAVSCLAPTGLSASSITTSGVTLSWSAANRAFNYTIEYKTATSSTWQVAGTTSSTSINLTGLSGSTSYNWRIKTNCTSGISGYAESTFATTGAPQANCNPPSGLSSTSITQSGATLSWNAVSGATSYTLEYKTKTAASWITMPVNITAATYAISGLSASTAYDWRVKTNCSGGSSAYVLASLTTIAAPVCNAPSGLTNSNISQNSATFQWSGVSGALNYTLEYKQAGATNWIVIQSVVSATSVTFNGLSASTTYDWRVKSNCSGDLQSGYSQSSVTTPAQPVCGTPAGLSTSNITISGATLSWSAVSGANHYSLEYKPSGSTNWISLAGSQATNTYNLTGLNAASSYDWRVRANCSFGSGSYAQSTLNTPALPVCNIPSDLSTTNISSNAATLNWGTVNGATGYLVEYKLSSAVNWTSGGTLTGVSLSISGLSPATPYQWRVRTNCSTGNSEFSQSSFTTETAASPDCPAPEDNASNDNRTTAPVIAMNATIYGKIFPARENDYYKFTVPATGAYMALLSELPADYDLRILNSTGTTVGLSQTGGLANETINTNLITGTYYVRVYGWNTASSDAACYSLVVKPSAGSIASGLESTAELVTTVFPNPVSHALNVEIFGLKSTAEITVRDVNGRKMHSFITREGFNQMNVSTLAPGFYFLQVEDEERHRNMVKFLKTQY